MSTAPAPATSTTTAPALSLPRTHSWPRIGVADVLLGVLVVGMLQRSQGAMLDDPGLGWHLRNIDAMLAAGGWLWTDPFTLPVEGVEWPWRTNVWLGDALLYGGWKWGGLEGIAAVTVLALAFTFVGLYRMLLADGLAWPVAALWTYLAALGTSLSWVARPNVFTLPGVMVAAWLCDRFHRGLATRRQTLWLLPMFALWANLHGGFVAGLIVLAVATAVETLLAVGIPHAKDRPGARSRAIHFALLTLGAAACCVVNPYGWDIYAWIWRLLTNPFFMNMNTEWQSPDFHGLGAWRFELFMLALPLVIALSKRRPSLVALALCVVFLHYALHGQRYVALYVLVAAPLVARLSVDVPWCKRLVERLKLPPALQQSLANPPRPSSWAPCGIVVIAVLLWARLVEGYSWHAPKNIPVAALEAAIARSDGRPIFHHYNWGGWLTWHGWPKLHTFIDDRNEVHGQAHIEEYFSIIDAAPGWRGMFDRYGFGLVCIPPHKPLAVELARSSQWRECYRDEYAVIFERVN